MIKLYTLKITLQYTYSYEESNLYASQNVMIYTDGECTLTNNKQLV